MRQTWVSAAMINATISRNQDQGMLKMGTLWMKSLVMHMLWLSALLLIAGTSAQAATYAYRNDVFSYDTPSGSATSVTWHATGANPACTGYPQGDDDWTDITFPSGFTFTFGGMNYSGVRAYSNGMLAFGTDVSGFHRDYTPQALPITTAGTPGPTAPCTLSAVPTNLMIPYWIDIIAGTASGITGAAVKHEIKTDAVTGQKRYVITWDNVALYGSSATRYSFQVTLYESLAGVNGNFKYQYTAPPSGGGVTGNPGEVGVQLTTTDYTEYSFNQAFIDPALGTAVLWYPANQLAAKNAEYRFDESSWTGAAGEIKDTSGSNQNASRVGGVTNVTAGKLCRGGSFTNNILNTVIDAVATPITPANTGSIDFWYKSNVAWNAASSDAMLFDATKVAAQPFFLMKLANGKLRFVITDSAGTVRTAEASTASTFAAGTWHHVGASWNIQPGTNQTVQQIFLDGARVTTNTTTPFRSTTSGSIATLSTVFLGDNRTSGITPNTGTPNGANATIDEVYIYAIEINATQATADMNITRPTCTSLDHFHIIHSGEVVSCNGSSANVTVEAHDVNHALFSLSGTTMQMATSTGHGTWSSVSTINPVNNTGSGAGNYTFSNETSIILGLTDTFFETLNINLVSGSVSEKTGAATTCVSQDYTYSTTCDADLTFSDSGFLFDVPNHLSETSQSVTISAVKRPGNSLICVPAFKSVTKPVTFTCAYTNPASGTLPVRVASTVAGVTTTKALNSGNNTAAACDATGQSLNLVFDTNGVATTTVQYADVGNMTLNAKYSSGGLNMTGSDTFITAPASFAISGVTAAPIKAGSNFSATVTAKNAAGATTSNFGNESAAEGVTLAFTKCQPTGTAAVSGSFSGATGAFTNGVANSTTLKWTEVGNGDLVATLASGSYLGSGLTATGNTGTGGTICNGAGNVGRFIPDHFDTIVTQGCSSGSFTYSAQPFNVQVKALNAAGAVTQNYDGTANTTPNFAKATTLSDGNGSLSGAFTNATIASGAFSAGLATATPGYTFTSALTSPTTIKLRATDTDAVNSSTGAEGTTLIRSGRARLINAYGAELLDLPMPFTAQYWNGSAWTLNSSDTCTTGVSLSLADVSAADGLVPADLCVWDTGSPGNSGLGCSTAGSAAKKFSEPPTAGNFNLNFKAPGASKSGSVDVTATVPAWLQFNWTGLGNANPKARATFGIYKTPIIYMRENY